jgi:uncharacterized protein YbjQ (UPF0145 family)
MNARANETPYRGPSNAPPSPSQIVVTTGPDIPGFRITKVLAVVQGVAMRPPGADNASARATRDTAALRLLEEARGLGANAIIAMRYDSTTEEVCAYGTAVRIA